MSKKKRKNQSSAQRKSARSDSKAKKSVQSSEKDLLDRIDTFLNTKHVFLIGILLIAAALVYLLMFDVKVSPGGDDAGYIMRAYKFAFNGEFPPRQGPVYPVLLGIVVRLAGIKVILLKLFSVFFMVGSIYFLYQAFKEHISTLVLFFALLLTAANSYIAFYASSTYSEALFMLVQSIVFFFFIKYFVQEKEVSAENGKINWKPLVVVGFLVFTLSQVRFTGFAAIPAMMVFFLLQKEWKNAVLIPAAFASFFVPFSLLKKYVLTPGKSGMSSQLGNLTNIHPYDASKGKETISGYFQRLLDNSDIYLSKRFLVELGFRPDTAKVDGTLTVLVVFFFALALFFAIWKRNKAEQFLGLYIGALAGMTFIILQKFWDQNRMILILYPLLYLFLLGGIYNVFKLKKAKMIRFVFPILTFIFFIPTLGRTMVRIDKNIPVVQRNLSGESLYGYTQDWENYIKMVQYVSKNLPEDAKVACRKPGIAFIYSGGKEYRGIFRIPDQNPDTLIAQMKDYGLTHIIRANLRVDPKKNTGRTINTIIRYISFIEKKYPGTFRQAHKIGNKEESYLYEIRYPY